MKVPRIILVLFIGVLISLVSSAAHAQQQFTQTVTAQNLGCNNTCSIIDLPTLNGNIYALIFITPTSTNGVNINHPIGAYYMYQNKWSVKNTDDKAMAVGATFNVEYFAGATGNQGFQYQVPAGLAANARRYIDYSSINNNSTAQIRVMPVGWFNNGSGSFNRDDVKIEYDAAAQKWFIANTNDKPVPGGVSYNVVFSSGPGSTNPHANGNIHSTPQTPISTSPTCNCVIPTSLPPSGTGGGDLGGNYPNPTVVGLQGRSVSGNAPAVGDILKWNGAAWEPGEDRVAAVNTVPAPIANRPSAVFFNQTGLANLNSPAITSLAVPGLDNQTFSLPQGSNVVFNTAIFAMNDNENLTAGSTIISVVVEILNSAGMSVAQATSDATLSRLVPVNINSVGGGVLPAGTYHTRVTLNRYPGGPPISALPRTSGHQGGQMIIEIFPN